MPTRIRARYTDGKLEPLEPLDLTDGCEVMLTVSESETEPDSLIEIFERLHRKYPPAIRGDAPTDGAKNYKHYLYGHPKVED